ncbi:MAG: hypothetical protein ACLP7J_20555, partial [Streptosporangiaceae bacterium]
TSQSVTKRHADLSPKASTDGSVAWSESAVVNSSDVTSDNRFSDDYTWGGATATFDPGQGPCGCSHADQYLHQEVEVVDGSTKASASYGNGNKNGWWRGSGGSDDYHSSNDSWSMPQGEQNTVQGS